MATLALPMLLVCLFFLTVCFLKTSPIPTILNNFLQTNLKILKLEVFLIIIIAITVLKVYIYKKKWVIPFKNYTEALNANAHHRQALILSSPTKPM